MGFLDLHPPIRRAELINPPRRRYNNVFVLIKVLFWCNDIKQYRNPGDFSIILLHFSVNSMINLTKITYL
jgi:hypothetical protein